MAKCTVRPMPAAQEAVFAVAYHIGVRLEVVVFPSSSRRRDAGRPTRPVVRRTRRGISLALSVAVLLGTASAGRAQAVADAAAPATTGSQADVTSNAVPSIQSSLGKYGDPGGFREFLSNKGIEYNFFYIAESLGNTSGGIKQGATFEGRLDGQLDVDFEKLAGVSGLTGHAQFFQIHGRGLSGNNTEDLFLVSNIEASPSTRLYELWLEKKLADGKLSVRAGQIGADTEFFVSATATLFVNSTFGWPGNFAFNLPSGGPAYPLAAPGARFKLSPIDHITFLAAIFDGDPAGPYRPGINNILPQVRNLYGTNFRISDAPLVMTEVHYFYNQEKDATGLPGIIKLGYLHHFGTFPDYTQPLVPNAMVRGDDAIYGVIDQTLYQEPGKKDQGLAGFVRVAYMPSSRNLIDFYIDGGLAYKGLFPTRDSDTLGFGVAYGRISPAVATGDILTGAAPLIRDFQTTLEATYQFVVAPGFTIQPDVQYIFHPGAHGVAIPYNGQPIHDAAVFGLRTTIHY